MLTLFAILIILQGHGMHFYGNGGGEAGGKGGRGGLSKNIGHHGWSINDENLFTQHCKKYTPVIQPKTLLTLQIL